MMSKENSRIVSVDVNLGAGTITIERIHQNVDYGDASNPIPKVSPMIRRVEIYGVVDGRLDMMSLFQTQEAITASHISDQSPYE